MIKALALVIITFILHSCAAGGHNPTYIISGQGKAPSASSDEEGAL